MFLIIGLICFALIAYLIHLRRRRMSVLARNGIPGPKPNLITGNLFEYRKGKSVPKQKEWIEKYGKIMGYYLGAKPTVLVANPDLVKNIQIKDFHNFADRPHMSVKHGIHPNPANASSIIRLQGKRWKEVRSALTPTFSASKLKTMTPIIDDSINNLVDIIGKHSKNDKEFDIYDMFQNLTTDVIGRTCFGIQSNIQNETNNKFLNAAKAIFNIKLSGIWMIFAIQCLPQLDYIFYPIRRLQEIIRDLMGKSPVGILLGMARDVVTLRKQNPSFRRKDLLQLMLDSKVSNEDISDDRLIAGNSDNESENKIGNGVQNAINNGIKSKKTMTSLTDDEIKANAVLFYEAGYETTSTALGFMAHILVNYPEVQEKLREEVNELYSSEGKLDFNTVSKLESMECVLNETMRLYPPVITFVARECLADYSYKNITIPKGATVQIPVHYLHHDPDYWPEPELFDPDRFSAERKHSIHSSSWQPFGNGPRNCIGLRFALFEAKLALAKILLKYRLEPGPRTELGVLSTDIKVLTSTPKNGVFVKAIKL